MGRFLFTMLPANDLGLPTRMVPIARALADRGHDVAVFNPSPAPSKLIAEAGLRNLPMPDPPMIAGTIDLAQASAAWDVEQFFAALYTDEGYVRATTAVYSELIRGFDPDVVIDSFDLLACLAARILHVPLVTVLQGNFHPSSRGFLWWETERPAGLPSAARFINAVAAEYSIAKVDRCVDLMAGDLSLIVGTPETDPLSSTKNVLYVGPTIWQRGNAGLPKAIEGLSREWPVVWVYSGNPRYSGNVPNPFDSVVVTRAAIEVLHDANVHVVLTSGFQEIPAEFGTLPANFHHVSYVPGQAMAERSTLMVHHGGYSSVMTGLAAGAPAVIVPTSTERESNARRCAVLGAGEIVMPVNGDDGEKTIDLTDFSSKIQRVLTEPRYRNSAQRVSQSMRKYGGAAAAADRIEQFAHDRIRSV